MCPPPSMRNLKRPSISRVKFISFFTQITKNCLLLPLRPCFGDVVISVTSAKSRTRDAQILFYFTSFTSMRASILGFLVCGNLPAVNYSLKVFRLNIAAIINCVTITIIVKEGKKYAPLFDGQKIRSQNFCVKLLTTSLIS